MDSSACVSGIERFVAWRGAPRVIWSDNGTNFVGAEKELLEATLRWNTDVTAALIIKGIRWKFNPTGPLNHGGSWDIMVRSLKESIIVY